MMRELNASPACDGADEFGLITSATRESACSKIDSVAP